MLDAKNQSQKLPDPNQNFWHLACIQAASFGLPVMLIGGIISNQYSPGIAVSSICIGNLILWIVGLSMVSMSGKQQNTIEMVEKYLGKWSGIFAAIILILAFIFWYSLQITTAAKAIDTILKVHLKWNSSISLRVGVTLGILTALFSIGGIRLIRRISVFSFPFLLFLVLLALIFSNRIPNFNGIWEVSFIAIVSVIFGIFPGVINLPTFFRHSRSKVDSVLALSIMTFTNTIFQFVSIWLGISDPGKITICHHSKFLDLLHSILIIIFVFVSYFCINLVNIYYTSAGWEALFPQQRSGIKEYIIVGLLGTVLFTFVQVSSPMIFLENIAESFIGSLGIVLLITFLIRMIVQHRPRLFEKTVSNTCWLVGCITAMIVLSDSSSSSNYGLIAGVVASALAFLIVIFIEETAWSAKKIFQTFFKKIEKKL